MERDNFDRDTIRELLGDVLVELRSLNEIHPEDLDVQSIMILQKEMRKVLPRVEEAYFALRDDDDPIVTDD